jgi:hypothetical protein
MLAALLVWRGRFSMVVSVVVDTEVVSPRRWFLRERRESEKFK